MKSIAGVDQASSSHEDAMWVAAIRSGRELPDESVSREDAYRKLMTKYWKLVSVLAASKVRDASDAEDIAQEAFLRAFRSLDRLSQPVAFLGWLLQIARNLARDHLRSRKTGVSLEALGEAAEKVPRVAESSEFEKNLDVKEETEQVRKALEALPEKYREVVALRYLQNLDGKAMAKLLGEPEGTIRNRLFRALEKLRHALQKKESETLRYDQGKKIPPPVR